MIEQSTDSTAGSVELDVAPLDAPLGALVAGIDTSRTPSPSTIDALKRVIADHCCVVIRDQELQEAQHAAFAECLGSTAVPWLHAVEPNTIARVKELPGRPGYTGVHPGTVYFFNGPGYRDEPDDGYLQGWHADMTHLQVPLPYATLHSLEAPDYGYETWFSNQYLAFETLDDATRHRVEGLSVIHSFQHVFPNLPKVVLPIVLKHPISGRGAVYGIPGVTEGGPLGVPPEEGAALMEKLQEHLESERFVYKHVWRKGDFVIWDNRCTLHRRGPQAKGQTRILRRIMAGDGDPGRVRNQLMGR